MREIVLGSIIQARNVEGHPVRVAQLVRASHTPKGWEFDPSQEVYLGCRLDSWAGHVRKATDQCFSHRGLSLSLSLINKNTIRRRSKDEGLSLEAFGVDRRDGHI